MREFSLLSFNTQICFKAFIFIVVDLTTFIPRNGVSKVIFKEKSKIQTVILTKKSIKVMFQTFVSYCSVLYLYLNKSS